jgi:hypothetical protein
MPTCQNAPRSTSRPRVPGQRVGALFDCIGHDAIEPNGRERHTQSAQQSRQGCNHVLLLEIRVDDFAVRVDTINHSG